MTPDVRNNYLVWLDVRFCLTFLLAARKVANDDLTSALLLGCVVGANLDHIDHRPEDTRRYGALGHPGDEHRHPVNSKSLSDSLGVPRETARAKVRDLVNAGVLRRVEHGVILPSTTAQSPAVKEMGIACLESLEQLVSGLRLIEACGIEGAHHVAQPAWPMAGAVIRLGSNHVVRGFTNARSLAVQLGLTDVIILLAVAHLTGGRLLCSGGTDADQAVSSLLPTPTGFARGSAIASFLRMPDATVRRHLELLVQHHQLTRSAAGYDLAWNTQTRYLWNEFERHTVAATAQFIRRLRQCGIVAASPTPLGEA